jgi:hypothetical protein
LSVITTDEFRQFHVLLMAQINFVDWTLLQEPAKVSVCSWLSFIELGDANFDVPSLGPGCLDRMMDLKTAPSPVRPKKRRHGVRINHKVPGGTFAIIVVVTVVTAGILSVSKPVRAQRRGDFSLSQEVHWGSAILPTGDYTYIVDSGSQPAVVRVLRKGGNFSALFLPQTLSPGSSSGASQITLKRIRGDVFVAALHVQGLGAELNFPTPKEDREIQPSERTPVPAATDSDAVKDELFAILNPNREKISEITIQKVYLAACETVERKFNWPTPIRPKLVLHLGAPQDRLQFPGREIQLRKWDDYRFAEGVVELAVYDLVPPGEKARLSGVAVDQAGATVNLCELKNCVK